MAIKISHEINKLHPRSCDVLEFTSRITVKSLQGYVTSDRNGSNAMSFWRIYPKHRIHKRIQKTPISKIQKSTKNYIRRATSTFRTLPIAAKKKKICSMLSSRYKNQKITQRCKYCNKTMDWSYNFNMPYLYHSMHNCKVK